MKSILLALLLSAPALRDEHRSAALADVTATITPS